MLQNISSFQMWLKSFGIHNGYHEKHEYHLKKLPVDVDI